VLLNVRRNETTKGNNLAAAEATTLKSNFLRLIFG